MRLSLFRSKSNTPSPSPTAPKKSSRLGSFLSPTKPKFDDTDSNGLAARSPSAPSLSPSSVAPDSPLPLPKQTPAVALGATAPTSDLSPLPSDAADAAVDSSTSQEPASNASGNQSVIDERSMTRKLMEVESSFVPEPVARSGSNSKSKSSTSVSNVPSSQSERNRHEDASKRSHFSTGRVYDARTASYGTQRTVSGSGLFPTTSGSSAERTGPFASHPIQTSSAATASFPEEDQMSYGNSTLSPLSQQSLQSSPAAAAGQRTKLRASSARLGMSSSDDEAYSAGRSGVVQEHRSSEASIPEQRPRSYVSRSFAASSLLESRREESLPSRKDTSDNVRQSQASIFKRPENIRKRQSSQRASKESAISHKSSTTIGPSYDGPSGEATPGTTIRESRELTRLPSFGSIASSVSGGVEGNALRGKRSQARTSSVPVSRDEAASNEIVHDTIDEAQLETPRASVQVMKAPTNTILAQHVRDVEVPDTTAREFRAAHVRNTTSNLSTDSTPFYARGKNTLTLKEQNSRLDKLTKENFDLKLKIHFLHQALQDRSDEGISNLLSQNAQLQADLVKMKKENATLRKKLRDLECKQKGWENNSGSLKPSLEESEDDSSRAHVQTQLEEEVLYLREQIRTLQDDNTKLVSGSLPESSSFDREVARRKQAERELEDLRERVERLKQDGTRLPHLRISDSNANLAQNETDHDPEERDVASLSGNTLVNHLRHENATLRRDLGAQTDMLSSRNRERERLRQEIEDLKLEQRRGDPGSSIAGDSILDRSISRAQQRSISRASHSNVESDQERDRLETVHATLRDENSSLKMRNQDLQRELNNLGESAEHIQSLQREKDEATRALRAADGDIDYLYDQLNQFEDLVLEKEQQISDLELQVQEREEESREFRAELDSFKDSFNNLADDSESNQATIQSLRQDIANANGELEAMENSLREVTSVKERLEVQAESAEGEIAFLREEQEADKLKIGDLQSALNSAREEIRGEDTNTARFEELESQISEARDGAKSLRNELRAKDSELARLEANSEELQNALDEATQNFENAKADMKGRVEKLRDEAEQRLQELDQAMTEHDEKDRLLQDRDGLLESSGLENKRLMELLNKEKQARKHDRNEYDRALRSSRGTPEARIVELEAMNTQERTKAAALQLKHSEQIHSRDAIFLSLWNRLSGLCTNEKLMDPEGAPRTMESVASDLDAFEQHVSTMIEAIETHISSFRQLLQNTETAMWKSFQSLEFGLDERKTRIEELEQGMQQIAEKQAEQNDYAATIEYLKKLKQENKLLKRELRYLKQGSFALPGLPSQPQHDVSSRRHHSTAPDRDYDAVSANSGGSTDHLTPHRGAAHRHSVAHGGSMLLRAHSAGESDLTGIGPGGPEAQADLGQPSNRSVSSVGAYRANEPMISAVSVQNDQHARNQQRAAETAQMAVDADSSSSAAEQRWLLKFEALKKHLKAEKEGRLLDRDGARKRLEEGKRQTDALKEELRRERVKREAETAAATGDAEKGQERTY